TILTYSGTLYDAIDNPQRQLFTDTCQKWAINFLPIPSFDLNASFYGAADKTILGYIFSKDLDPYLESVKNGSVFTNRLFANSTISPFM
ncbi:hypothetical protein, partial [Staphylococcus aureus]|uniref:hypothetical protein n=1 Tax=Staphylococcus aureus TaxID=1280 RepID=UPI0021B118AD